MRRRSDAGQRIEDAIRRSAASVCGRRTGLLLLQTPNCRFRLRVREGGLRAVNRFRGKRTRSTRSRAVQQFNRPSRTSRLDPFKEWPVGRLIISHTINPIIFRWRLFSACFHDFRTNASFALLSCETATLGLHKLSRRDVKLAASSFTATTRLVTNSLIIAPFTITDAHSARETVGNLTEV